MGIFTSYMAKCDKCGKEVLHDGGMAEEHKCKYTKKELKKLWDAECARQIKKMKKDWWDMEAEFLFGPNRKKISEST